MATIVNIHYHMNDQHYVYNRALLSLRVSARHLNISRYHGQEQSITESTTTAIILSNTLYIVACVFLTT